jgi:hypothetical protein
MSKLKTLLIAAIACALLAGIPVPGYTKDKDEGASRIKTADGDVILELVGQVRNPSPTTSNQYGYLSSLNGVVGIFNPGPQNESTARFTFFTEAVTTRVINNGALRIVNRTGTTTIYRHDTPGDFTNPNSFRDGTPLLTASLKQQVILDTVEGTFTATNVNTVTSVATFAIGDDEFRLGKVGDQFRTSINGRTNTTATPAGFVIAGYAVAIEKARPESE